MYKMSALINFVPMVIKASGQLSLSETVVALGAGGIAVVFALLMLFSRRAVYAAMSLIGVMLCLAVIYTAQYAPFLGVVQVVVYTGAIMMLILFVLMLVGIDASDARHETIPGQRIIAVFAGVALVIGLIAVIGAAIGVFAAHLADGTYATLDANASSYSNPTGLAMTLLSEHAFTIEIVGTLLIIGALGAMTLTHRERLGIRKDQMAMAAAKMQTYATTGQGLTMLPPPGVFAESNSAANPALGPDQQACEASVPRVLLIRGQAKSLPEASPSTAMRQTISHNVQVSQGGLPGMPGKAAPIPADPTAKEITTSQEKEDQQ